MVGYKEQNTFIFTNYSQLKRSLHGNRGRRMLLVKLKEALRKLGLSKRARRVGLRQLAVRPCVVLKRWPASSYKEKSLQSLPNSNQNFLTSHKESQYGHRDDAEKRQIEDSQYLLQQSNTQILSAAAETAPISILDASKTCRNEKQDCNLLGKELSNPREKTVNPVQDFTQKATKKDSQIYVTSTKHRDVSKRSDIEAACSSSSSKDELIRKQNFPHKFANKNSCSKSKIDFSKDKSISVSAKKVNINEECPLSENKSSDTTVPLRLTKHRSDPKRSINSSEDANVFARQHKEKVFSLKTKLDTLQECSNESRTVKIFSKCNVSSSNIISEAKANDFTNENENAQLDLELVKHIDTSLQYKDIGNNISQTKINLESKYPSTVSLHIRKNSKEIIKRKVSTKSLDQNALPIKIRKKNEINTSSDKVVLHNNIEISKYKLNHTEQKIWGNITRYMTKNENYKSLKRRSDKYKEKQEQLQKYFKESFDPDTSETEEDHKILLNYVKRKQQSDLLHNDTTKEEENYIFTKKEKKYFHEEGDKKLTHDTNFQKNIKSINFNNSDDFTTSIEECAMHDATMDTKIKDKASIGKRIRLANSTQENMKSTNSDNSCDSTACTKKCYAMYNTADEVEEASTCKNETLINNSQENTEDISSDHSCDSSASTKKDTATKMRAKDGALTCTYDTSSDDSQENTDIVIFRDKAKSNGSCDSTVMEKFMHDATTDEEIEDRPGKHGTFANNSQKNITESTILPEIKSDNSCNSTVNTEKNYATPDTTTEKKIVKSSIDGASTRIRDVSANNSQKSIENAKSIEEKSDNSCDSTANIKKYYSMHDVATDKKVENRASKYISSTSANDLQRNKRKLIPVKKKRVKNSLSIVATENNNKSDTRVEQSKDINPSTIEMGLNENTSSKGDQDIKKQADITCMSILQNQQENQEICNTENVDLKQDIRRHATSNLGLPIAFAHDSALCNVNKKNSCDMLQNVKNLLTSNDISKDGKTSFLDQSSVTKLDKNSLERRCDESCLVQMTNSSISPSQSNCNHNHSSDDDNSSDIEVEIKIKPKLKSQILQKFSLKAPWSAVNSCIENLHTLKDNPNSLNNFFEINHKSSERSKHTITNKSPENNMSLSDNQNVIIKTEKITYDSVSTAKDNAKCSQQQNFQNSPISKEDENAIDSSQRERDKCMQLVETTTQIKTENNSLSRKLACGMSELEKQIHDASTRNKRKHNEKHSQDNTIIKKVRSESVHNQKKEDKNTSCIEQKKIQTADNPERIKTAYNMPDLEEQLPQTFSDMTHSTLRSITEINCRYAMKFSSLKASDTRRDVSLKICQSTHSASVSPQSESHPSESLQLTSQSAPRPLVISQLTPIQSTPHPSVSFQVAPTQSAPCASVPSQLAPTQLVSCPSVSSQLTSTQSTPHPSVSFQIAPTQSILHPSVSFQIAPTQSVTHLSVSSQLPSTQSAPRPLVISQLAPIQSTPHPSVSFQVAPTQSAPRASVPFQLAPIQSVSCPSVSSQLTFIQLTRHPSVSSQLSSAQSAPRPLVISQLTPTHSTPHPSVPFQVTPTQSAPRASVPSQLAPTQSVSCPSVSSQLTSTQSTPHPSVSFQIAPTQSVTHLSVSSQLPSTQSAPRPLVISQLAPIQSTPHPSVSFQVAPTQSASRASVLSQLAPTQSVSYPSVSSQLASTQSTPHLSVSFQIAPTQSAPRASVPFRLAPIQSVSCPSVSSQLTSTQSVTHLSVSSQLPSTQSAPRPLVISQLAPIQSTPHPSVSFQVAPTQSASRASVLSQLAPTQSVSCPSVSSQLASTQSTPHPSVSFQVAPTQSAPRASVPSQLAPTKSVSCPSVSSQLASTQSAPTQSTLCSSISSHLTSQSAYSQLASQTASRPSVPSQLISQSASDPSAFFQSTHPELTFKLVPKLPSYDTAINKIHFSSKINTTVTPVEINTPNVNNELTNHNNIYITMKNLYYHIGCCRNFNQYRSIIRHISVELTERISEHVKQIYLNLINLKILLWAKDIQSIVTYINQYTLLNPPLTVTELNNYLDLLHICITLSSQQNANASQHPNVGESVSSASISNANTQSSFRNAPFPDTNKFKQSSILHPVPTISNINQQQLLGNSTNYSQIPHSGQPMPNMRQQYKSHISLTAHSHKSNVNQQQSLENPIQSKYMRSANISNVGTQEAFVNMSNVSSWNINMHSYGPVNQGNVNVRPISNMRQPHVAKNTISSTAIAFAANVQQQKQIYSQSSQINSRITICPPLIANQNVPLGTCQTVHNATLSESLTVSPAVPGINTAIRNVKHQSANVNQQQVNCISQVSPAPLERTNLLPQYNYPNPNETSLHLLPDVTIHKMQNHSIQNILPGQNMQQISQQKLLVNQANANVRPANNTGQSNVTLKNVISSTETANQHLQPKDSGVIDLSISNISQNVQQSVNKEIPQSLNKDYMRKKTQSTNLQRENLNAHNILQNTSGTSPKTSTLQSSNVFPNTIMSSQYYSDTSGKMFTSPKNTQANQVIYNFNLMMDNQAITLYNQMRSYFHMLDKMTNSLNKQECERIHREKTTLFYFYQHLHNYLKSKIRKVQTVEKYVDKESQDNISEAVLQENTIQTFVDKLTKTQSNQVNENTPVCNNNLKEQSSKQNIDSYIKETSKSTMVKSNLAQNKESLFTPEFATRTSLSKYMSSQESNNNLLKKLLLYRKKPLIEKQPKIIENVHETSDVATSNNSTGNDAPSQFSCNTKDQNNEIYNDNNKIINKSLKDKMRNDENIAVLNSTEIQCEPLNISPSLKQVSLNNMSESVSSIKKCKSTEIMQRETHAETISKFYLAQQEDPTNEWSDDSDTTSESSFKLYIDENPKKLHEQCVQEDNLSTSQNSASLTNTTKCESTKLMQGDSEKIHEKQVESREFYLNAQQDPTNNFIDESSDSSWELYIDESPKKSQNDEQCDEISSSEKDNLSTSRDSVSFDTMYESSKKLQVTEKHAETISEFCSNAQQEDFSNEQSNNSIDEMFESSGKLHTDESAKNTKIASSFSKNISEANSVDMRQEFMIETQDTENIKEENSEQSPEKHAKTISEFCSNAQQEDFSNEQSNNSIDEMFESSGKLHTDESAKNTKVASSFSKNISEANSADIRQEFMIETQDTENIKEENSEQSAEKHAETISEFCSNPQQEDFLNEQSNNVIDETFESSGKLYTDESAKNIKVALSFSKNISEANSADICQEFVTETQNTENIEEKSEQSLLKIEEMYLQEIPLTKIEVLKDEYEYDSMREHAMELTYLSEDNNNIGEFLEDIQEEKMIIDTHNDINLINEHVEEGKMIKDIHNDINTINEQLQYISKQTYQSSSCNFVQEDDPVDVNEKKEISTENDVLNVNIVECTSVENDNDSKVTEIIPNIVNIRSISPSLFEKLDTNIFFKNNLEILNKNDEKSMNINDDLEISDVNDIPCLRCKRKSMVRCQACLEATYCSKRCSALYWKAIHHKQCKGDNFTYIDLV
ncbi:uncharacterized protein LOC105207916 isoform X2 [Solenopsis invicta]|uniref:uncharacterized protein LOC105207916 isoform X2 n=1 Tax=Solenopsis invicta TaxID=13686 RepID=UPI00193D36BB|nr:uncharacterized protein LOC105207916 isoform X2 [Solenopsis invicta]XP_039302596.1 uncharacterized protein LOC105207916 isoform X2 [Solenopsis invicta]XP_039302597.1 uncharacterized protein LOC105207916 isoform X2 [Solenopsis invicta]XP_039302598.1 uncharacterized protein LOC105207916 isoform X2 [Solenopsis invicta]